MVNSAKVFLIRMMKQFASGASGAPARTSMEISAAIPIARNPVAYIRAVGLAFLIGCLALVGLIAVIAQDRDTMKASASRGIARAAVGIAERDLARMTEEFSWWNDAVTHLTGKVDPAWAAANIGTYQTRFDLAATFVVDASGRTAIAFLAGKAAQADAFASLSGGLGRLVQRTRDSRPPTVEPASGFLAFNGRPAIVAASAITPELGSPAWPVGVPRSVVVSVRQLDQAVLDRLAAEFDLKGLRFLAPGEPPSGTTLPLLSPDGTIVATLTWTPGTPGQALFLAFLLLAAAVALAVGGSFRWFLRQLRTIDAIIVEKATIIDQILDPVIVTDARGLITGWNLGAERMFGYAKPAAIARPITLIHSPEIADAITARIAGPGPGADRIDVETEAKRRNGELCPVRVLLSPLRGPGRTVTGVIAYIHDITEQKGLEGRLAELSTTDELTGAFNRRYLMLHGPIELQRAKRFKRPLSFLFLDLDHFKRVNDNLGHQFGDLVLSTFSDVCRRTLRPSDMFVRYGGEEFVAMLPETGFQAAAVVAGRIAQQIRQTVFSVDPPLRNLTVSIGVTALRTDDDILEPILERADRAMYHAKELGRDRVETIE